MALFGSIMVVIAIVQVTMCLLVIVVRPGFAFTTTPAVTLYKSQHQHHGCIGSISRTTLASRRLYSEDKDDDKTGEGAIEPTSFPELLGLEQARVFLQDVLEGQFLQAQDGSSKSTGMIQQPILTETGRHRRQLEMDLIASLANSDDALDELVHFWIYETGDLAAAACISHMQESCSDGLSSELQDLQFLIAQYPAWAEPRVRLAAVLYYKGRLQESRVAALAALQCKPWHFEAVQLLIMLALRQEDMGEALYWARRYALPNLRARVGSICSTDDTAATATPPAEAFHKRRQAWVDRALHDAELQWQEAERVTQEMYRESSAMEPSFANDQVWQ
jgi:hypothetical protein